MPETYDFERATRVEGDAVGKPGHRRFRLLVASGRGSAWLWLEKEQLQALGAVADQLLSGLPALWTMVRPGAQVQKPSPEFTAPPTVEFTVGHLTLEYDEVQQQFLLQAHDVETDPEGPPTLRCTTSREQLVRLGEQVVALTAAGRYRCRVCGTLMAKGELHVCPGSNGHGFDVPGDAEE